MTAPLSAPVQAVLDAAPTLGDWFEPGQDGRLVVKTGRVELGQGNLTALLQIAADTLGIRADQMEILAAQTGRSPDEGVTAGSMSISVGGMALRHAARALGACLEQDRPLAEALSGIDWSRAIVSVKPAKDRPETMALQLSRLDLKDRMVGAPFLHDIEMPNMVYGAPVHWPDSAPDLPELSNRDGVVAIHQEGRFTGILARSPWQARRAADWALAQTQAVGHLPDAAETLSAQASKLVDVFNQGAATDTTNWSHESRVFRPTLSHGSIGPSAAIACWDGDHLRLWTHSQGIYPLRRAIAQALEIDVQKITVRHVPGAGCYGHNGADDAAFDAVLMARAVPGRPVKVVWSRRDEFAASPVGAAMVVHARASLSTDGCISAFQADVLSTPHSTRPGTGAMPHLRAAALMAQQTTPKPIDDIPMQRGGGADRNATPGYDIPNIRIRKHLVQDYPRRTSALRSLGAHANVYAIETLMDQLAASLGEDPIAFRLRHLSDPRGVAVIARVREMAKGFRVVDGAQNVGWGVGYARYKGSSGYMAAVVRAEVEESLRVTDVYAAVDIGEIISMDGARNQIEGGILQTLSWTTKESHAAETESWLDYPILNFSELPRLEIEFIEPVGVPPLGCGELAQGPVAGAIGNAVFSVFGKVLDRLPLTRENLVQLLVADYR